MGWWSWLCVCVSVCVSVCVCVCASEMVGKEWEDWGQRSWNQPCKLQALKCLRMCSRSEQWIISLRPTFTWTVEWGKSLRMLMKLWCKWSSNVFKSLLCASRPAGTSGIGLQFKAFLGNTAPVTEKILIYRVFIAALPLSLLLIVKRNYFCYCSLNLKPLQPTQSHGRNQSSVLLSL